MEWSDIFTKYNNNLQNILKNIDELREQLKPVEIYPSQDNILKAFNICPFNKIKIVIIGQDPYHGINQATGLCFGVQKNNKFPPSLKNINEELKNDLMTDIKDSTLEHWGQQGVLLLNSSLTVVNGKPGSHMKLWSDFTDFIISQINEHLDNIIFILWGQFALNKIKFIDKNKHHFLISSHPSPLSVTKNLSIYPSFKNSKPFSKSNEILKSLGKVEIAW